MMYLPKINTNARNLASAHRLMSSSVNSRSTNSSSLSSSTSSKANPTPLLIQLCMHSDENYACRTMRLLLSSQYHYSPNVCDEFGCNLLMSALRYQRYRLVEYLLKNISLELNFQAKDRQGNSVLHYAIIYSGNEMQIIDKLIEKYRKFGFKMDERNNFGFTPLLLAAFSGRYDFVLTLLTKTDASPFVRDYIQLKSLFDYIEMDMKQPRDCQSRSQTIPLDTKSKRLIQQTLPSREKISAKKNFFELFFLQSIEDQTGLVRSAILRLHECDHLPNLLNYLNHRYPRIKTARRTKELPSITKFVIQRENSNINVHQILNLFDPTLKPKAIPPPMNILPAPKAALAFKRLSSKVITISAFSKAQTGKKRPSLSASQVK